MALRRVLVGRIFQAIFQMKSLSRSFKLSFQIDFQIFSEFGGTTVIVGVNNRKIGRARRKSS
jgi:hypothetical protein